MIKLESLKADQHILCSHNINESVYLLLNIENNDSSETQEYIIEQIERCNKCKQRFSNIKLDILKEFNNIYKKEALQLLSKIIFKLDSVLLISRMNQDPNDTSILTSILEYPLLLDYIDISNIMLKIESYFKEHNDIIYPGTFWLLLYRNSPLWDHIYPLLIRTKRNISENEFHFYIPVLQKIWDCFSLQKSLNSIYLDPSDHNLWQLFLFLLEILPISQFEINFISKYGKSFRPVILSLQKLQNEILRVDILCSLLKIFNYRWWFHSPYSYDAFNEKSLKRLLNSNKQENVIKACDISIVFFRSIIDIVQENVYKDMIYEIIQIISNKLQENHMKFIEVFTQSILIGKRKKSDFMINIDPQWLFIISENISSLENLQYKEDLLNIIKDIALNELITFKKECLNNISNSTQCSDLFMHIWNIVFNKSTRQYFQDIIFVSYSKIGFILPELFLTNSSNPSRILEWYFKSIRLIFSELSPNIISSYERSLILFNLLITYGNNLNITIDLFTDDGKISLEDDRIIDTFINHDNMKTFLKNIHEITSDILSIKQNYPKDKMILLLNKLEFILSELTENQQLIKSFDNEFKLIIINVFLLCKSICQESFLNLEESSNIHLIKPVLLLLKLLYTKFDHYKYIIDHIKSIKLWGTNLLKWKSVNELNYYVQQVLDSIESSSIRNYIENPFKSSNPIKNQPISFTLEKKNDIKTNQPISFTLEKKSDVKTSLFNTLLKENKTTYVETKKSSFEFDQQNDSSSIYEPKTYNQVDNSWRIQSLKKLIQHNAIMKQPQQPKQIVVSYPNTKKVTLNNTGKKKENALIKEIKENKSSSRNVNPVQPNQLNKRKDEEKINFEMRKKLDLEKSREVLEQSIRKVTKPVEVVSMNKNEGSGKVALMKVLKEDMKIRKYIATIADLHNKLLSINYYKMNIDECFGYQTPSITITNTFKDENHYKEVFEPLLIEELKAQLEKSIQESDEKTYYAKVSNVGRVNNMHSILFTCDEVEYFENDVLLISEKSSIESPDDIHVIGIVLKNEPNDTKAEDKKYFFKVKVRLMDNNETRIKLFKEKLYGGAQWRVKKIFNLSTCTREWQSLQNCGSIPLFKTILNPVQSNTISKPYTLPDHLNTIFNRSQIRAIQASLKPGFTLIQGPPGTGKTTTIIGILSALLEEGLGPILLCAPSNCAVDEITLRIIKNGLYTVQKSSSRSLSTWKPNIIRAGIIDELTPKEVVDVSLQKLMGSEAYNENISTKHSNKISRAHIVSATLSSSGINIFRKINQEFKTVIIDESAQATELSVLIPLQYNCTRCIMVGDPQQLPATIFSQKASSLNYEQSLFERFKKCKYPSIMLDTQYRMHPLIRKFPGEYFYENKLKDGRKDNDQVWHKDKMFGPYLFFNIYGKTMNSKSLYNASEASFIVDHLERLIKEYPNIDFKDKIGIITPYRSQVKEIKYQVKQSNSLKRLYDHLDIHTIDSFQGKEKDIIIFSTVRSQGKKGIGFLSDIRRINVAITRAKYSLWIVGDSYTLEANSCWRELIDQAKKNNVYIDMMENRNY